MGGEGLTLTRVVYRVDEVVLDRTQRRTLDSMLDMGVCMQSELMVY